VPHPAKFPTRHVRGPWRLPAETALEKVWMHSSDMFGTVLLFSYSYGHLPVISTYNPIHRMYNPINNQL
jgi:hypothetical protein